MHGWVRQSKHKVEMPCSHLFRITLAGESGVGKSWFVKRFTRGERPQEEAGTVGVDFESAVVAYRGAGIKLHFWDTAGQMSYRKIVRAYFRSTDGVLLFFDVTNRASFTRIAGWLAEMDAAGQDKARPPTVIVGTKIDDASNREVGRSEATAFAMREGCMYEEVSAASNINVGETVLRLTTAVFDHVEGVPPFSPGSIQDSPTTGLLANWRTRGAWAQCCRIS